MRVCTVVSLSLAITSVDNPAVQAHNHAMADQPLHVQTEPRRPAILVM
jgi:hypothetical protein